MLSYAYHLLLELIPVFLLAIIASSLIDHYLPDSYINKLSNIKNKSLGIYFSALIGSLIPICTCGMIPLTIKLHQKGLDWRYLCSFLVAGNACSITALILTSAMGMEITLVRFFASVVFGVFVTNILVLISKTKKDFNLELLVQQTHCCDEEHEKHSLFEKITHDLIEISKNFLPWILLAVIIATLMHKLVNFDTDSLASLLISNEIYSPLLASLVGFPFYFCAGADVPISAELLNSGVSIGTLISFMLASPGVNLTSFLVYKKAIGTEKAGILIAVSILVAFVLGLIINLSI